MSNVLVLSYHSGNFSFFFLQVPCYYAVGKHFLKQLVFPESALVTMIINRPHFFLLKEELSAETKLMMSVKTLVSSDDPVCL